MKILGIESASLVASVAVVTDGLVTAEYTVDFKKTHSQTLLPMIDEVTRMLELDLHEVDAIAVSGGPGSYRPAYRLCNSKGPGPGIGKAAGARTDHGCHGIQFIWNLCPHLPHHGREKRTGLYGTLSL